MNTINKQFPENLSRRDAVKLTRANAKKMSELSGSIIEPQKWVLYEDQDAKTGEIKTVLSIESNGEIFGTISPTFIREFTALTEEIGDDLGEIKVVTMKSKNGREFVTCELV